MLLDLTGTMRSFRSSRKDLNRFSHRLKLSNAYSQTSQRTATAKAKVLDKEKRFELFERDDITKKKPEARNSKLALLSFCESSSPS